MNAKKIVKFSNIVCIIAVLLLCYWVFTFIVMEVFGLKVFRENITQSFYLSILGILALMFGALITNVMFNLTRIAEKHNADAGEPAGGTRRSKLRVIGFIALFPLIGGMLFCGDYLTSRKKEVMLIKSAESIVSGNKKTLDEVKGYEFTGEWIGTLEDKLELLSAWDKNFRNVSVIVADEADGIPVLLVFGNNYHDRKAKPRKADFIFQSDLRQRDYLNEVFAGERTGKKFFSGDGEYEMFYPIENGGKVFILYFQDRQRYGKIGS